MKYKLLRFSLLSVLVMLCGGAFALMAQAGDPDTLTIDFENEASTYTAWTFTNIKAQCTNSNVTAHGGQYFGNTDGKASGSIVTKEIIPNPQSIQFFISKQSTNTTASSWLVEVSSDNENWTEVKKQSASAGITKGEWTEVQADLTSYSNVYVRVRYDGTTAIRTIDDLTLTYTTTGGQTDTRVATSITLDKTAITAAVGDVVALPSAALKAADENNIPDAVLTWESSDETVAAFVDNSETGMKELNALKVGTATITVKYAGNTTYKPCSASFTLTVKEYTPYTTIASMLANYTTTQDVKYSFTGLSVIYVNGKYTYIHMSNDGDILLYCNSGVSGLEAEATYNGYIVGQLKSQNGLPELYVASAEDIHAEKQQGMVMVDVAFITVDQLKDNLNKMCAIQHAEYVSADNKNLTFKVGETTFIAYNAFGTSTDALEAGKKYTVEGFGAVYAKNDNTTYQIYPTKFTEEQEAPAFRDIKADLTQLQDFATGSDVYVAVANDGSIVPAAGPEEAAATLKGNWHSTSYGWSNFTASVPVQGCVKITYATHDYGNDIVVTNAEGTQVAKFNTTGAKWMSNHDNVVVAYYRTNEPTTLNFSKANYNPYFAVEAIDPADLPAEVTNYNITFAAGEGATGVAPAALEIEAGGKFTAPKNYTLYKEGATLTGWNDGTKTYAIGEEITPAADMTLTAQYTANEVSLADRTEAVTIDFALDGYNANPKYNFQSNTGIIVTQATVNGKTIDVKADINATGGKFAYNGSGWHQVNAGTKVTVPSAKGAIISVSTYNDGNGSSMTFAGNNGTADNNVVSYTATAEDATCEIAGVANNYWNKLTITLPQPQPAVEKDITGTWSYADTNVMAATMALSGSSEAGEVSSIEGTLKMTVVANGASFRNNGNNIQVRSGAEFRIPVRAAGDLVTIKGYPGYSYYMINDGEEITNTNDNPQTEYKAKASDAERGYVSVVSSNDNNYFLSLSVVQYAKKEKITLDNEPATATFPFNEGTEDQKATFSNVDYFLSSKVTVGSNWFIKDKTTYADTEETRLEPVAKHDTDLTDDDAVRFLITPKPGFTFKPTKVGFKANRFGTDNGKIDAYWQYSDGTTIELETGIKPERNNSGVNTVKSYDIEGGTAAEGTCGLKLFLYNLQEAKQIGLADIVIEGILNGTEKDVPVLASFKINSKEYAVEDVFGEQYEATLELPKAETMVSANNPLTDVTAKSGEVGTITYEEKENACTVTIPMTAGETTMNYVLNVTFKPDFTLSYLDVEGNVLGTQAVEKDATIGAFAYDIADVTATKDGYKARGWFKQAVVGEKFTTADVITADTKLYAIQTEIEVPSTHKKYNFDLTDKLFYAEDHEAFNPAGEGYYWHDAQHGWAFKNGNTVDLLVGPKATITVTLCQYGSGTGIAVKKGDQTLATLDGIADGDGGTAVYNYEGEAGTLTLEMQCGGEMYIHAVKIVNTAEVNFESEGDWYFVKAGDAGSLLDVIDVVNGKNAAKDAARSFIYLPNGTYDLDATVKTAITGHNISIIGESMDKTIIVTKPDKSIEGLGKADLFDVSGTNLYMQDLTLKNALDYYNAGSAGRAAVLQDAGNRTIGKNVRMLSYQDTYYSSNNSQQAYWEDCDIHGTVDFICGGGDIRFQNSTISLEPRKADGTGGRTIVAPTTNTNFGYVFDGCTIVDLSEGKGDWNFGRTWQNEPITVYLNTTLDDVAKNTIVSKRWTEKGMNNKDPKVFGEYGTKDASGADITPASNVITSFGGTFETILTAEQAAAFAYDKMFTDWSPASLTAQIDAAILNPVYENGTVSFAELDNGMQGCAIFKNDEFVAIAGSGYAIAIDPAVDKLTVRAVNMMGGFGPAAQVAGTATSIQAINAAMERGEQVIYNLSGQRVNKATKGLYIINGRKVVVK